MRLLEAQLSESGRPILQPGEVECQLIDATDIDLEEDAKPGYWNALIGGIVSLTTHRTIWIERIRKKEPRNPRAFAIPHSAVASVHPPRKGGLKALFGEAGSEIETCSLGSERRGGCNRGGKGGGGHHAGGHGVEEC